MPDAVPVTLDPAVTAVLVLDLTDLACGRVPAAKDSLVTVRRFLDRARRHATAVIFSLGRIPQEVHPDLGRRED